MAPAERVDVIVDFRQLSSGGLVMLRCLSAGWDILELRGTGASVSGQSVPAGVLSTITALTGPATPTRTFSFDGMTRINGLVYDIDRIDFTVPVGTVERWRFVTNRAHSRSLVPGTVAQRRSWNAVSMGKRVEGYSAPRRSRDC
jgi:FtsP/CotA-like multicopper oxidase with cupredoxin domain